MQQGITYNLLVWDSSAASFPFPKEIAQHAANIKWDEYVWNASGLPTHGALYSVVGNKLYFEEHPDGKVELKQIDFTGEFLLGTVLMLKDNPTFFICFKISVLKGEVMDVELHTQKSYEEQEYQNYVNGYSENVKKIISRQNKWWYRYLYLPYMIVVRTIGWLACGLLRFIAGLIAHVVLWLTPI
jgi:hypothetical protein